MRTNRACSGPFSILFLLILLFFPLSGLFAQAKPTSGGYSAQGIASWYGIPFHGRKTANGEIFNRFAYSAAHRSLAFGTLLLVTNLASGQAVVVRVNDRGPFIAGRILDLSEAAAQAIGMIRTGTAQVSIREISGMALGPLSSQSTSSSPSPLPSPLSQTPESWCDIQVASFSKKENADSAAARLSAVGYLPEIRKVGAFYRVLLLGLAAERAELERLRLEQLGYPGVLVSVYKIAKPR